MESRSDVNTYLHFKRRDGTIDSQFIVVYARTGYGKTLAVESAIEEFHRMGYTVLILSDVKRGWEFAYSMFEPKKPYHVHHLRHIGKPIQTKKVKLYHPFTFDIPKNKMLPEINFYGFALNSLRKAEWSILTESYADSDATRILLNAASNLDSSEGIYSLLHTVQDSIIGKKEKKKVKPDWKKFGLRITAGTPKNLQEIQRYFLDFKRDYFLLPNNSKLQLNWGEILNDNEHYHFFGSKYIREEKIREFCILSLFRNVLDNQDLMKKPVLIVIPEIRFLVPNRPKEVYKEFLAHYFKSYLSIMRNMGKGVSGIFDSQVWYDVEDSVKTSIPNTFLGELGALDIERISKTKNYGKSQKEQLAKMDYPNSYFWYGYEGDGEWTLWFPGHMHAEPEYQFEEIYKQHYYENPNLFPIKNYGELLKTMQKQLKDEETRFRDKEKRMEKQQKEESEKKLKEKEAKDKKKEEIEKKKEQSYKLKSKQEKKELIYKFWKENPELSFRELGRKVGINHITAKKYIEEFENKPEEENVLEELEEAEDIGDVLEEFDE